MDDYISKTEALDIVRFECGEWSGLAKTIGKRFDDLPHADVQLVRHGRWEIYQVAELGEAWTVQCSVCHAIGFHGKTSYCCECGARMDGEKGGTQ